MVDLFTGIPDELIESTLQTIRENLDKVGLFGGHTLRKHTDIQLMVLKNRLTKEDIRYATSYWDVNVAAAVASGLMRKFYDSDIVFWLKNSSNDYIRQNGEFHSIANDVMTIGTMKSWIVKAQFSCSSSSRSYHSRHPLIPIVTEHLLLFQKENVFQIPYSFRKSGFFYLQKQDSKALTWFHLVCAVMEHLGGIVTLSQLYEELKDHPKAVNNKHYKERIRATLYEHRNEFLTNHRGSYRLSYM